MPSAASGGEAGRCRAARKSSETGWCEGGAANALGVVGTAGERGENAGSRRAPLAPGEPRSVAAAAASPPPRCEAVRMGREGVSSGGWAVDRDGTPPVPAVRRGCVAGTARQRGGRAAPEAARAGCVCGGRGGVVNLDGGVEGAGGVRAG